ncbi:MAG TPA: aspartate kinase [Cryomorphaceae bacterium]|nr:aspartate kinase [Owenweeksia sp.]HAD97615.1 aspartate kinase [Cryomorphaceae bacterium]HBF18913.1 aspartate kinase [Cryomorphaceae bacterium]|tara:strand:+ start:4741 stop:5991 length:1251 start_codon:yes stop_codon:yes gene_type:complete
MKVFKFGGASVKDADSVRNVANVLNHFPGEEILIVVSAMGKTTNALEKVVQLFFNGKEGALELLQEIKEDHLNIIRELFAADEHRVHNDVEILFSQLDIICQGKPDENFNKAYDQIVSYGELISTKIISSYLNSSGYQNKWLDARRLIRTDQNYRFARVDWNFTERLVKDTILPDNRYVVQGFIGSDDDLNPTTLGREGSDYTASVLGYVLGAEEVVIWKDVPGVLNGDPKVFDGTALLNQISYREAIELAYYGASVIHPKTIQPLQKKNIPLRVKSFVNPDAVGTLIREGSDLDPVLPCFIKKDNQVLITVSTRDLAFIVEEHLSKIYKVFHQYGIRVNLSQNTAVSSSFCINHDPITTPVILDELQKDFDVSYNEDVKLYSVRHYDDEARTRVQRTGKIMLEQISRNTYQVITV